jgi:hypothetical protein
MMSLPRGYFTRVGGRAFHPSRSHLAAVGALDREPRDWTPWWASGRSVGGNHFILLSVTLWPEAISGLSLASECAIYG